MESLLARALESKLKYWLRSFTREQFKLQGRTVRLYNLDINGEVLHASIGLPPTLLVTQARVGRLELKLPSLSNVQTEPIVVEIDKLDVVLMEKSGNEPETPSNGIQGVTVTAKSGSYGFADKIADGMTLQVGTVNLMLETRGGAACRERAAWTPPLASITIRNLLLYTTNERWQVVNLKDAREFSSNKKCIYVFKKLEWESLSVDLLPHPDMFTDERLTSSKLGSKRDDDGAKRLFFGGERFLDNISGEAYITMHRTEQNNALGMEVQVHLPDVLCPALSEPGLRALLRFMTGLYVCMNRGDVVPKAIQSAEAAGRTMVAVTVEHIFLCIKDAEFQLEVILQCLQYMRASTSIGESTKTMTRIAIGGLFLRDTLCHPSCTLVQPSMRNISNEPLPIPNFANEKLWPRIYPLEFDSLPRVEAIPLLCMYSLQTVPSPAPPSLASQTVIQCQPLKINLQEESCLRIASFLADGVVVEHGVVIPATSVDSIYFSLKEFDLTIPIDDRKEYTDSQDKLPEIGFTGTRLHVEDFVFAQAPSLNFKLLKLDKDPACFALWQGQPVDASQKKWVMRASRISAALETDSCDDSAQSQNPMEWSSGLWPCVEMLEPCIEAAMVTADGRPLVTVPPPGGIVRFGIACKHYISNTSVEQLFFVLKMFEYMGRMSESLLKVSRAANKAEQEENPGQLSMKKSGSIGSIIEMAPSDTAVSLGVDLLELKFLESLLGQWEVQGTPLVQISGSRLRLKVTHRTLGGAVAISSKLFWQNILVECVETDNVAGHIATCFPASDMVRVDELHRSHTTYHGQLQVGSGVQSEQKSSMRAVLWIAKRESSVSSGVTNQNSSKDHLPFLDVDVVNVIPYRAEDAECHSLSITAKVAGVRLGGGMVYNEALLHRFGILGPDGEPGKEVKRVLKNLSSGPFANILKPPPPVSRALSDGIGADNIDSEPWDLGSPDDINIDLQLWDWVFALEGASIVSEDPLRDSSTMVSSTVEGGCWLSTFRCLHVSGQGAHNLPVSSDGIRATQTAKYPVQKINVGIEGVEVIKPHPLSSMHIQSVKSGSLDNDNATQQNFLDSHRNIGSEGSQHAVSVSNSYPQTHSGLDVEVRLIISEDEEDLDLGMGQWVVESLKAAVTEPVEVEATKAEVEYLIKLFKLEIESASRIAAGIMKLLQLQGSIGQATIDQLSNLGSGSLDKLITPERTRRRSSIGSVTGAPFYNGTPHKSLDLDPTMAKLEEAVSKSQEICAKLNARLIEAQSDLDSYVSLPELTSLMQQLDTMKGLLEKSGYKVL